ncbi:MAG: ATP-binding protein [Actinomycetota bacterium]
MTTTTATTMGAMTTVRPTTPATTAEVPQPERAQRGRLPGLGLRGRVLVWFMVVLALAVIGILVALRAILLERADQQAEGALNQEVAEFRMTTEGLSEGDARDLRSVFEDYLLRTVTDRDEVIIAFIDTQPVLASAGAPVGIETEPEVMALGRTTGSANRVEVATSHGRATALAVPVRTGGAEAGVLAVLVLQSTDRSEITAIVTATAVVAAAVLLLAGMGAWGGSSRAMRPLRELTDVADGIDETDLSTRIELTGDDEVGRLAQTFNAMLDRLQVGFANQERLLADIGHELRTPISVVQGHLDVMGDDPDDRAATVELISDELDRMHRLVNDLLLLAQLDHPGFLHLESIDVLDLATDVVARANSLARRDWSVAVTSNGTITADRQRLIQAVMNLVANAIDHTEEGGSIVIGGQWTAGATRLWVQDDGPGIPEAERARIFERFAKGEHRRHRGAGLGLSIVAGIAHAHGGTLGLGDPGPGARFVISLPTGGPPP